MISLWLSSRFTGADSLTGVLRFLSGSSSCGPDAFRFAGAGDPAGSGDTARLPGADLHSSILTISVWNSWLTPHTRFSPVGPVMRMVNVGVSPSASNESSAVRGGGSRYANWSASDDCDECGEGGGKRELDEETDGGGRSELDEETDGEWLWELFAGCGDSRFNKALLLGLKCVSRPVDHIQLSFVSGWNATFFNGLDAEEEAACAWEGCGFVTGPDMVAGVRLFA